MSFWKKLFFDSDAQQLSECGVEGLLQHLPRVHTEILQFFEPGTTVGLGQEVWIPNVLAEFRDPSVAVVYGEGVGHAFVRVQAIFGVAALVRSPPSWLGLVQALERNGYRVKHIHYFCCENRQG